MFIKCFPDTWTRRVPIFVSAKQIYMLSQTYRDCYRMLAHSHSATRLYNFSQSAIRLHHVHHLTCERAWFSLVLFGCLYCVCHFGTVILASKISWFYLELAVLFSAYSLAKLFRSYLSTWKLICIWYVVKYHVFLLHI
jgi:hypothetical protein